MRVNKVQLNYQNYQNKAHSFVSYEIHWETFLRNVIVFVILSFNMFTEQINKERSLQITIIYPNGHIYRPTYIQGGSKKL